MVDDFDRSTLKSMLKVTREAKYCYITKGIHPTLPNPGSIGTISKFVYCQNKTYLTQAP